MEKEDVEVLDFSEMFDSSSNFQQAISSINYHTKTSLVSQIVKDVEKDYWENLNYVLENFKKLTKIELANFLKLHHKLLRFKYTEWNKFLKENPLSTEIYSKVMSQLAQKYWPQERLLWFKEIWNKYFYEEGLSDILKRHPNNIDSLNVNISVPLHSKDQTLNLLDVGSCYNQFSEFSEVNVIPIDLKPAMDSVFECDFLEIVLDEPLMNPSPTNLNQYIQEHLLPTNNTLTHLPSQSFDIIVFSMLLSYIPTKKQRYEACIRAHKLLKLNGLLLIVEVDSRKLEKTVSFIRKWKKGFELMGFKRSHYSKEVNTHRMGFRKVLLHSIYSEEIEEHLILPFSTTL